MIRPLPLLAAALAAAALLGCEAAPAPALSVKTIAKGLDVPWGLAFLPDGRALVGERNTGRILVVPRKGGRARPVMRIGGLDPQGIEGGLLGLAVSPNYERDHLVYAYVTTATDNRIVRFRLGGAVRPILTGLARGRYHDGGRIAFGPDGRLYASVGDATRGSNAQDLSSLNGKILRMNPDGSVPRGNPFAHSLVWSLGHRNVEGLAWDRSHRLWASEFGEKTYDEINLIRPGRNYGWPGVEGPGDTQNGKFTNPVVWWSPTSQASPSGVAIRGSTLYAAGLQCQCLWRVPLHGTRAGKPSRLLAGRYGRLRTVVRAPDGSLWVTTSNRDGRATPHAGDDRILRVKP